MKDNKYTDSQVLKVKELRQRFFWILMYLEDNSIQYLVDYEGDKLVLAFTSENLASTFIKNQKLVGITPRLMKGSDLVEFLNKTSLSLTIDFNYEEKLLKCKTFS